MPKLSYIRKYKINKEENVLIIIENCKMKRDNILLKQKNEFN